MAIPKEYLDSEFDFGFTTEDTQEIIKSATELLQCHISDNTNILFKNIYKTDIKILIEGEKTNIEKQQELLANKIFLYLIYNYVIRYNKEDPYIIHKLNNIYLHTFENIYNIYIEEEITKFIGVPLTPTYYEILESASGIFLDNAIKIFTQSETTETTDTTEKFTGSVSSPTSYTPTSAATAPAITANKAIVLTDEEKKAKEKEAEIVKKLSTYVPIDKLVLLDKFNTDIKKMYDQINSSFTIKFLLPVNITRTKLLDSLNSDADLILKYINKYNKVYNTLNKITGVSSPDDKNKLLANFEKYMDIAKESSTNKNDRNSKEKNELALSTTLPLRKYEIQLNNLKTNIHDKITAFADVFTDYNQENKTLLFINTTIYKINFYLAAEMMQVIIFILLVLFMLYKSKKYPFLEKYINMSIVYAILIVNEVISAILGII